MRSLTTIITFIATSMSYPSATAAITSSDPSGASYVLNRLGIGTTAPAAGLDVAVTGTGASAIVVPRDSTANRPSAAINGMLRYNTTANVMEGYVNGAWSIFATGTSAAGGALSSLTAATANNTLANANFPQIWNWDTLTSQNGLQLASASMTTGSVLNILNTNNSTSSNGNMVNLTAAGASNSSAGLNVTHSGSQPASTGARVTMASSGTSDAPTALQITSNAGAGLGQNITMTNSADGTTAKGLQITASGGANYGADINMSSSGAAQTATGLRIQNGVGGAGFGANIMMINSAASGKALSVSSLGTGDGVYSTTAAGRAGYFSATSGYGLIVAQGNVGIGTSAPQAGLDIATSGTGGSAIILPRDSTANRPSTAVNGMVRYNTSANALEAYINGSWQQLSVQPVGSTANVTASGPPVSAGIYSYSVSANYTPAFGAIANIKNGVWPANGTSDYGNASCVNLYDPSTSPQQTIVVDLGSAKTIGNVYASIDGYVAVFTLGVSFSLDGVTYTSSTSLTGPGSSGQAYYVTAALGPSVTARYIRLTNGASGGSSYYYYETLCQFAAGP